MKTINYLKIAVIFIGIAIVLGACGRSKRATAGNSNVQTALINGAVYNFDGIELVYVEGKGDIMCFYIGKYLVTQEQWQAVMGANPSIFNGENLPIENVSWNDAQEFFSKLNARSGRNYRLPTEAEWEFAAGGGIVESFCTDGCLYSGSDYPDGVGWFDANSNNRTQPVGTKHANELGIYDMSGNLWELTNDLYDDGAVIHVRGGCWASPAEDCNIKRFYNNSPNDRNQYLGFRVVLP